VGGTGSWSAPYKRGGYDVIIVDPEYTGLGRIKETVEDFCKRELSAGIIHGILAAPPCTQFCSSGARWWKDKEENDPEYLEKALGTVFACLEVINKTEPVWWALENPIGRLSSLLGPPIMKFDPYDFGDPYTKKTCLWGNFTLLKKVSTRVQPELGSYMTTHGPGKDRSKLRSITPPGFATAFFKANP